MTKYLFYLSFNMTGRTASFYFSTATAIDLDNLPLSVHVVLSECPDQLETINKKFHSINTS